MATLVERSTALSKPAWQRVAGMGRGCPTRDVSAVLACRLHCDASRMHGLLGAIAQRVQSQSLICGGKVDARCSDCVAAKEADRMGHVLTHPSLSNEARRFPEGAHGVGDTACGGEAYAAKTSLESWLPPHMWRLPQTNLARSAKLYKCKDIDTSA